MHAICDESGAKGYADVSESFRGECGVFVAVLVPDENYRTLDVDLNALRLRYWPSSDAKPHITDLPVHDQQRARDDLWSLLRRNDIRWAYEAIYVEGFRRRHMDLQSSIARAKASSTSGIRVVGNPKIPSFHVALFEGLFATIVGVSMEDDASRSPIRIELDHVDAVVADAFERAASEFLAPLGGEVIVNGYDAAKQKRVTGKLRVSYSGDLSDTDIETTEFSIAPAAPGSGAALAADIVANSLRFHFENLQQANLGAPLGRPEALDGYPIADLAVGFPSSLRATDVLFSYPSPNAH